MKFLCPSCKAKYQIADEKVAGRSVRMKCRKCGHVIQVSSVAGVGDALLGSEPPSAIDAASDEDLFKNWTLQSNGKTIMTLPKIAVLRSFVMNHMIHHRAQLGVYLRLNDIPVPSIYGPSADEGAF